MVLRSTNHSSRFCSHTSPFFSLLGVYGIVNYFGFVTTCEKKKETSYWLASSIICIHARNEFGQNVDLVKGCYL